MPKYMLLLHDNPGSFAGVSPEQMQKTIERYLQWGNRLREAGLVHGGHKLTDEPGRVMRSRDGQVRVTDGPFSESKEILGGYYVIEADSYEQALDRARDCPHLDYGSIEVRQIDIV
jgi:hypothetical protein